MILFDYVYYLCCRYFKRNKVDHALDAWRANGLIVASLFTTCIIMGVVFILLAILGYKIGSKAWVIVLFVIPLLLNILRYNKFTGYADIHEQVLTFSERKKRILNIAAGIYMFVGFPGALILAIVLGPTLRGH